jgi:hypothetical protein
VLVGGALSPIGRRPDGVDERWTVGLPLADGSEAVGVTAAGVEDTSGAGSAERTPGMARRCRTGACPSIDACGGEGVLDVEWLG